MAGSPLKIDARRKKILELLDREGQVRVSQLSEQLGATSVTIRSDLDALEREGYLERIPGGAIQSVKNFYHLDFTRCKLQNMDLKKSIAQAAIDLVHDGDTLMINSGTTTYFTAVELKRRKKNLNIVTNSIMVAMELGAQPTFRVILLGGDINVQYSFVHGYEAQEQLGHYKAKSAILSIDGISSENGLTTYHAEEAIIDRIMIERAHQTIIVADSSKLEHEGFSFVADLSRADHWVTDKAADGPAADKIRQSGVDVTFA